MSIESDLDRSVETRIEKMESALAQYRRSEITRQKFFGVIRSACHTPEQIGDWRNPRDTIWACEESYLWKNRLIDAAERIEAEYRKEKHESHFAAAAGLLGIPENSQTVRRYVAGEIDIQEAKRIAEIVAHRHEKTDYDTLLENGVDKETARQIMQ